VDKKAAKGAVKKPTTTPAGGLQVEKEELCREVLREGQPLQSGVQAPKQKARPMWENRSPDKHVPSPTGGHRKVPEDERSRRRKTAKEPPRRERPGGKRKVLALQVLSPHQQRCVCEAMRGMQETEIDFERFENPRSRAFDRIFRRR